MCVVEAIKQPITGHDSHEIDPTRNILLPLILRCALLLELLGIPSSRYAVILNELTRALAAIGITLHSGY